MDTLIISQKKCYLLKAVRVPKFDLDFNTSGFQGVNTVIFASAYRLFENPPNMYILLFDTVDDIP